MFKKLSFIILTIFFAGIVFFGSKTTQAADLTVDGKLTVSNDAYFKYPIYAQGNEIKFGGALKSQASPQINFNIGASKIYDDANLTIRTDDYLYLATNDQDFGKGVVVETGLRVNRDTYLYYPLYFYGNEAVVNNAGTLRFRDPDNNNLLTITDAGTTGNIEITGGVTVDGSLTASGNISMWTNDVGYVTATGSGVLLANGTIDLTNDWTIATKDITLTDGTLSAKTLTDGTATLSGGVLTGSSNVTT
jgi:hypothetical protein